MASSTNTNSVASVVRSSARSARHPLPPSRPTVAGQPPARRPCGAVRSPQPPSPDEHRTRIPRPAVQRRSPPHSRCRSGTEPATDRLSPGTRPAPGQRSAHRPDGSERSASRSTSFPAPAAVIENGGATVISGERHATRRGVPGSRKGGSQASGRSSASPGELGGRGRRVFDAVQLLVEQAQGCRSPVGTSRWPCPSRSRRGVRAVATAYWPTLPSRPRPRPARPAGFDDVVTDGATTGRTNAEWHLPTAGGQRSGGKSGRGGTRSPYPGAGHRPQRPARLRPPPPSASRLSEPLWASTSC